MGLVPPLWVAVEFSTVEFEIHLPGGLVELLSLQSACGLFIHPCIVLLFELAGIAHECLVFCTCLVWCVCFARCLREVPGLSGV